MKYVIDCEFNGMNGALLSLALVEMSLKHVLYLRYPTPEAVDPWVAQNVIPFMDNSPVPAIRVATELEGALALQEFFKGANDPAPHIIADWPDDIAYISRAILTGPGKMIDVSAMTFEVIRVDAYPTKVAGAVQHNAMWDAMALRRKLLDDASGKS